MLKKKLYTIKELSDGLERKDFSALELADEYISRARGGEGVTDAFLTFTEETARCRAKESDERIAHGERVSPLDGIPCAVKDNICTSGIKTTCASRMLADFVPCYDAAVITKLKADGYVPLGKTNMDEFAMGSSTENSAFKITKNPRDLTRVPGGSSGGSAACVADGEAVYALGSDTGGSIRQPAAFCGVVGLKPTYGAVSRYGLVAFASSLDQIGPLTGCVSDSALVFDEISFHDARDSTSSEKERVKCAPGIEGGVKGLKLGLPAEFFKNGISAEVKEKVLAAARVFEGLGAEVSEVAMPHLEDALPAYYVISSAEASSNLARFDGVRYGYRSKKYEGIDELYKNTRSEAFGEEVKRRIMIGTFALSSGYYDAYYKKALEVRSLIAAEYRRVFENYDLLLSPVAPSVAYKIGEKTSDPLEMYMGDMYTVPVNIAGVPALSMPCGETDGGLPVGMQLIGRHFSEPLIFRAARAYETRF